MQIIRLSTWMNAPIDRCFQLATSIDLHRASAAATEEKAIDGVTTGLITEGQTVQWRGRHFGRNVTHTSKIDGWRPYQYFHETMVEGWFLRFEHEHHFALMDDGTRMRDEVRFVAPYKLSEALVRRRLLNMLKQRNLYLKQVAESEEWRRYLGRPGVVAPSRARDIAMAPGWGKLRA